MIVYFFIVINETLLDTRRGMPLLFLETNTNCPPGSSSALTRQKQLTLRYYFFRYGHPLQHKKRPHPL